MRKQAIIPLAVGLVVGLIALKLGYDHLCRLEQANARTGPTEKVLVATRDIPVAVNLTAQDVKLVDMPKQFVPEGVLVDPKKVIGKSLKVSTAKRMPILASMVHTGKGFGGVIPKGYRAVSVKVDEYSGVAGFLQPGAFVDVVGTFKLRQKGTDTSRRTISISKIVLQGVEVRAVGQKFREDVGGKEADLVRSVTLLVKPVDVERLQLASSLGKIRLALRAPLDMGRNVTSGVTMATLLQGDNQFQQDGSTAGSLAGGFWDLFSNKSGKAQDFAMTEGQPYLVELISPEKVEKIYFESAHSGQRVNVDKLPSENSDNTQ